ncbi:DUF2523 family protein [Terasakiella pusilla]|uniref:DUF2523 family protein n=1 Tax=Terasakiella pusilla TaxID=64973 RepID=UPI003AA960D5
MFWTALVSGLFQVVNWIFRAVVVKFVMFTALGAVLLVVIQIGEQLLDLSGVTQIGETLGSLPADIGYYMGVFQLQVGIPMILTAALVRFTIRRLPIIG